MRTININDNKKKWVENAISISDVQTTSTSFPVPEKNPCKYYAYEIPVPVISASATIRIQ